MRRQNRPVLCEKEMLFLFTGNLSLLSSLHHKILPNMKAQTHAGNKQSSTDLNTVQFHSLNPNSLRLNKKLPSVSVGSHQKHVLKDNYYTYIKTV